MGHTLYFLLLAIVEKHFDLLVGFVTDGFGFCPAFFARKRLMLEERLKPLLVSNQQRLDSGLVLWRSDPVLL
jgi:hypothetical protein